MKSPLAFGSIALSVLAAACGTSSAVSEPPGSGGSFASTGGSFANAGGTTANASAMTMNAGGMIANTGGTNAAPAGVGGAVVATGGAAPTSAGGIPGNGGLAMGGSANGGTPGAGGGSGGVAPSGGAPSGGEGGSSGSSDICGRWQADRANLSEGAWSGSVMGCDAGDLSPDARANALRLVNLYRFLAGLPAVTDDPTMDAQDQQCALMMRANNMLSHMPPMSWTCWTQEGATAANGSNIGTAPAVASIDGYMLDPGNPTSIGHRRWLLSNQLGPIGIGGTDHTSCLMTTGGTGHAGKAWTAWPPPGDVPYQVMASTFQGSVDTTGWTVQSDTINLSAATVTVMFDGAAQPVTVTQLGQYYGSTYAIRFNPQGWTTQAGKKYSVSVGGVTPAIAYDVNVVACN